MKNRYAALAADGILAGVMLCIGCAVNLSVETRALGAFLFSLGLFAVIRLKFGLYTGKAGYMAVRPLSYIAEVLLTLAGNIAGAAIGGGLLNATRFADRFSAGAAEALAPKLADTYPGMFVLAFFCGILMFIAVEGNRRASEKGDSAGGLFLVVVPVMVFILSGFNHSIADLSYFFISGCAGAASAAPYFVLVILGNAAGCMFVPFLKRLTSGEKFR